MARSRWCRGRGHAAPPPAHRLRRILPLVALVAGVPVLPPAAALAGWEMSPVGTAPVAEGETVVPVDGGRTLVALNGGPLSIRFIDGGTLRERHRLGSPEWFVQGGLTGQPEVHAFEPRRRRLHVIAYKSQNERLNTENPSLLTIEIDGPRIVGAHQLLGGGFLPRIRIFGMQVTGPGRLTIVGQSTPDASALVLNTVGIARLQGVWVAELDAGTGRTTWGPHLVRGCQVAISRFSPAAVGRVGDRVVVGCGTGWAFLTAVPGVPAVASIPVDDPASPELSFLPGRYAVGESYYDDRTHRLILVGTAQGAPGQAVWIFDAERRVFVGSIAAGDRDLSGAGVDPASGRLYVGVVNEGVTVGSDRGVEVDQGFPFESVRPRIGPITPIAFNRTLIVPTKLPDDREIVHRVYRDPVPDGAFLAAAFVDPRSLDARSSDVPTYTGDAQAFGLRVHQIAGLGGAVRSQGPSIDVGRALGDALGLRDGNRDVHLGRVGGAFLSAVGADGEASASSAPATADDNTASDHQRLTGEGWPFGRARCVDFGSAPASDRTDGARASCAWRARTVSAEGSYEAVSGSGVVSVGSAGSRAEVRLDADRGLVATVHAEARDIRIGGAVEIGYAGADVAVVARGTPGSAGAGYERVFRDVSAGSFSCRTVGEDCTVPEMLAAISAALGSQVRAELPPEDVLETRGGARAHVLLDPWAHQQDVVLNDQERTEIQVPALRLIYVGDNASPSRATVDLAAVAAGASYLPLGEAPSGAWIDPARGGADRQAVPGSPASSIAPPVGRGGDAPPEGPSLLERAARGWRLLLRRPFGTLFLSAALWALLGTPVLLGTRRRHVLRLARLR